MSTPPPTPRYQTVNRRYDEIEIVDNANEARRGMTAEEVRTALAGVEPCIVYAEGKGGPVTFVKGFDDELADQLCQQLNMIGSLLVEAVECLCKVLGRVNETMQKTLEPVIQEVDETIRRLKLQAEQGISPAMTDKIEISRARILIKLSSGRLTWIQAGDSWARLILTNPKFGQGSEL